MQNRHCVTVWDSRFSCLFVYVRGTNCTVVKSVLIACYNFVQVALFRALIIDVQGYY